MEGLLQNFGPLLLILVVFYFFMIRPQMKKAKEDRKFKESLSKGDQLVTIGGVHGKVLEVRDTTLLIEVESKTKMVIERSAVSREFTKGTGPSELAKGGRK